MKFEKKDKALLDISVDEQELKNFIVQHAGVTTRTLGEDDSPNEETIQRFLPKFIAKKIAERIPDGFELSQLIFTGEISGRPFNIGFAGSVTAIFNKVTEK
jgi:hypothetical protein